MGDGSRRCVLREGTYTTIVRHGGLGSVCDVKERYLLTHLCGSTLAKNVKKSKNGGKSKNGDSNCYEVVCNLGVEVGHLKTARTNTLVRDTADYRLSSKQLKRNELPKKDPNRT